MNELFVWFTTHGGTVDSTAIGLTEIPDQGRGAVALRDIPNGYTLFTIPRTLTLSTRTSSLPQIMGPDLWKHLLLDKGWAGLILCMMWEESRGKVSPWSGYLASLPRTFSTLMFWNEADLSELKGCTVLDKIGKASAELEYLEKIVPALRARPELFAESLASSTYSLENFHTLGSQILSRSFTVERWEAEGGPGEIGHDRHSEVVGSGPIDPMDVDNQPTANTEVGLSTSNEDADSDETGSDNSDDSDDEDPSNIAMVPLADMLNARFGSENAKLFYERDVLKMITLKPIEKGEQIYNTYGDPPNSDLLRRYGHVDLVPLNDNSGRLGSPADVVEIGADLVLSIVEPKKEGDQTTSTREMIEWWLEEGGDDVFVLEGDCAIPDELVSFTNLMICSEADWRKSRDKGRPPKPKIDSHVLPLLSQVLRRRLEKYSTTLKADEEMLNNDSNETMSLNFRNALIVRIGEKRILEGAMDILRRLEVKDYGQNLKASKEGDRSKRKRDSLESGIKQQGKKSKR